MDEPIKVLTPVKAIRAKCLDCCCGSMMEVKLCPCVKCTLHPYRLGHRPRKNDAGEYIICMDEPSAEEGEEE